MRLVGLQPGRSQRALADQLGVAPSKIVSLADGLEARDYMKLRDLSRRVRLPHDRTLKRGDHE
jgi:DNA-binding MarR family transcriptional regulator